MPKNTLYCQAIVFFALIILICLQQPSGSLDSGADSKSLILDQPVQGSIDEGFPHQFVAIENAPW